MKNIISVQVLLMVLFSTQAQQFLPSEFIINSTIKIEVIDEKIIQGQKKLYKSTGTGFFLVIIQFMATYQ
jgi:hypothetical protein